MIWVVRILTGAFALFFLVIGIGAIFSPDLLIASFSLGSNPGMTARSAVRADMGAFFTISGLLALIGLWPGAHRFLLAALALVFCAFVGRVVGVAMEGINRDIIESMLIEILSCAILIASYWMHHRREVEKKLDAELAARENGQTEAEA